MQLRLTKGLEMTTELEAENQVADFSGRYLREQDLSESDFTGISFKGADLRGANLANSIFKDADFEGADLTRCNLRNSDFTGANLEKAILKRSNLCGANFTDANMASVDFLSAKLFDYKVNGNGIRYVTKANFTGTILRYASFLDTLFADVISMAEANLEGADFTGADLRWVDFERANLKHARFNKTDLTDANLEWSDATNANFTGAKTEFMHCTATNLSGAIGYLPPAER